MSADRLTSERSVISCAGVVVDGSTRTVTVLGRLVPAHGVSYSEASPERPGTWRVRDEQSRALALAVYGTAEKVEAATRRPVPAMPEAVHFNIVCENGWWIEVSLYPEDDALRFDIGGDEHRDEDRTALDLLATLAEVGSRPRFVATDPFDDAWSGIEPGEWLDRTFGFPVHPPQGRQT